MRDSTTSAPLLVEQKLLQLIADGITPDMVEQSIQDYISEHGVVPGFTYQRLNDPASNWIIDHNLNKYPQITLLDDEGNMIEADVFYNNVNQVTVVFAEPISGKAVLI